MTDPAVPVTTDLHELRIADGEDWAVRSAEALAQEIATAVARRGQCLLALSGGSTPWPALAALADRDLAWDKVIVLQTDERLVPLDHPDRNLAAQRQVLDGLDVTWLPLPVDELLAALDGAPWPDAAFDGSAEVGVDRRRGPGGVAPAELDRILGEFAARLISVADDPPVIDVAQLGLGVDGHTASLIEGDPAIEELRRPIAVTDRYDGHRRVTLTRPVFDRARAIVWLVAGRAKAAPLGRLLSGDLSMPAGLIRPARSVVVADADAARQT